MHKAIIIGHLGRDPEMRFLPTGQAVTSFSVASDNRDKHGTEWFNIVTFGKLAEITNQYLQKGSHAYFEGSLHKNEYEKRDGGMGSSIDIVANTVQFLDSAERNGNGVPATAEVLDDPVTDVRAIEDDIDDLPF